MHAKLSDSGTRVIIAQNGQEGLHRRPLPAELEDARRKTLIQRRT
jgi:hypothetical protein